MTGWPKKANPREKLATLCQIQAGTMAVARNKGAKMAPASLNRAMLGGYGRGGESALQGGQLSDHHPRARTYFARHSDKSAMSPVTSCMAFVYLLFQVSDRRKPPNATHLIIASRLAFASLVSACFLSFSVIGRDTSRSPFFLCTILPVIPPLSSPSLAARNLRRWYLSSSGCSPGAYKDGSSSAWASAYSSYSESEERDESDEASSERAECFSPTVALPWLLVFAPRETAIRTANASALKGALAQNPKAWHRHLQLPEFPRLLLDLLGLTPMLHGAIDTAKEALIARLIRRICRTRRLTRRRHPRREKEKPRFGQDDQHDQEQDDRRDREPETPRDEIRRAKVSRPTALFGRPGSESDDLVDGPDEPDAGAGVEAFHVGFENVRVEGDVREHGATQVGLRFGELVRGQEEGVVDLLRKGGRGGAG